MILAFLRNRLKRAPLSAVALFVFLYGCNRVDLPSEEEKNNDNDEEIVVDDTQEGNGSLDNPYTVMQLIDGVPEEGTQVFLVGYIVGWTSYSMSNASFDAEGAVQSNVLLADTPNECDPEYCVPVELSAAKYHEQVALKANPNNMGRRIRFLGTVKTYFRVWGLRDIDTFDWVKGDNTDPSEPDAPDIPDEPKDSVITENPKDTVVTPTVNDTTMIGVDDEELVDGGRVKRFLKIKTKKGPLK